MKTAIIDIGSNSVRLMLLADGKVLCKEVNTTRLGEGLEESSLLSDAAIARSVQAIYDFNKTALNFGAEGVYAFATAAVRKSLNADEFLRATKVATGIEIDVISGEREAEIGIMGALGKADGGILDVGGASSELSFQKDGKFLYKRSLDIGAVRLYDKFSRNKEELERYISLKISELGRVAKSGELYGIGGTATSLAVVKLKLKIYDSALVHGTEIYLDEMKDIVEWLFKTSVEDIAASYAIKPKRAEIIAGGALLVYGIMKKINADKIIISERDNLEGYAALKGLL